MALVMETLLILFDAPSTIASQSSSNAPSTIVGPSSSTAPSIIIGSSTTMLPLRLQVLLRQYAWLHLPLLFLQPSSIRLQLLLQDDA